MIPASGEVLAISTTNTKASWEIHFFLFSPRSWQLTERFWGWQKGFWKLELPSTGLPAHDPPESKTVSTTSIKCLWSLYALNPHFTSSGQGLSASSEVSSLSANICRAVLWKRKPFFCIAQNGEVTRKTMGSLEYFKRTTGGIHWSVRIGGWWCMIHGYF